MSKHNELGASETAYLRELLGKAELVPTSSDKIPLVKWSGLKVGLGLQDLLDLFWKKNTTSFAIKCGTESGLGVYGFDIDTKHLAGFDGILLPLLSELFPDVFKKFQIERSPSGGLHFLFQYNGVGRRGYVCAALERLVLGKVKWDTLIEFKGVGSLLHSYPSSGYTLEREGIGVLSGVELDTILGFFSTFNEKVARVEPPKVTRQDEDYYSESPFKSFDSSSAGASVLDEMGWRRIKMAGRYTIYAKPESRGIRSDATYDVQKGIYKIWSETVGVDARSYTPSSLICEFKFGGDKKDLFRWLVSQGYGRIKPEIEARLVKRVALNGGELPANASEGARERLKEEVGRTLDSYPFGIFWEEVDGSFKINRERLLVVARDMGFRSYQESPVQIVGYRILKVKDKDFFNSLKAYIKDGSDELLSCFETFLQNSGKFTVSRLCELEVGAILRSKKDVSYKFFKNVYLEITTSGVLERSYGELDMLIWDSDIRDRDFKLDFGYENSMYWEFLQKAIGIDSYLKKCIGFYAHDYRDQESYMCIATEQCENPKDGGGSGKNVFWSLLKLTTTFKSTAASMIQRSNQLFQSWNGERIFVMADIPKDFDLMFFKDIINDGSVVRKLYKDEFNVEVHDLCKIAGSSNYSFDDTDAGVKRRIRPIEFTNFFTLAGGVKKYFGGKMFPNDWSEQEYIWFDNIIILCIQEYLKSECTIELRKMSSGGFVKQFTQKYTHLSDFIQDRFWDWVELGAMSSTSINDEYEKYCRENQIHKRYTSTKLNIAIEDWCEYNKVLFEKDAKDKVNGIMTRCKKFTRIGSAVVSASGNVEEELPF